MTLIDQYLRMADLANQPERKAKTYTTRSGQQRTVTAKAATRGITGFSAKHIYHLINEGKFPRPLKIGRASLWRLSEINRWLDSHAQLSDDNGTANAQEGV
jgi:prophage regulatory protein